MIRPSDSEDIIAVIDWETAALGPRFVDLVSITAGRWTKEQRDEMKRAYTQSYELASGIEVGKEALDKEFANIALYKALWWVGYWSQGDDAHINRWVKELKKVMELPEL